MSEPRTALVTGGSRGIGAATVLALAERGFNVVVNYLSRAQEARQLAHQAEAQGVRALAIQADVSDYQAVGRMTEQIRSEERR